MRNDGDGERDALRSRGFLVAVAVLVVAVGAGFLLVGTLLPGRYDTGLDAPGVPAPEELAELVPVSVVPREMSADVAAKVAKANELLSVRHGTGRKEFDAARALLLQAVAAQPDVAQAHVGLALTYWLEVQNLNWGGGPEELRLALDELDLAISLGAGAPAYRLMAQICSTAPWPEMRDLSAALSAARTAVELDPNDPDGFAVMAQVLVLGGNAAEAIELIEYARLVNPDPPPWYGHVAGVAYLLGDMPDQAVEEFSALYEPGDYARMRSWPGWLLVSSLAHAGQLQEASDLLNSILVMRIGAGTRMLRIALSGIYLPEQEDHIVEGVRRAQRYGAQRARSAGPG